MILLITLFKQNKYFKIILKYFYHIYCLLYFYSDFLKIHPNQKYSYNK